MATSFEDLPVEIIELIAWEVGPKDLLNLRLVNKYVAASTERPMLKRNIADLNIVLGMPASLRKALKVARAAHLRKYVDTVAIIIDQFQEDALQTFTAPRKTGIRMKHMRVLGNLIKDQEWLIKTGNDERDLREIFYWLRPLTDLQVVVLTTSSVLKLPHELSLIKTEFNNVLPVCVDWNEHRPLQITMNAIKESNLQSSSFVVASLDYGVPFEMFSSRHGFWDLQNSFHRLTHLSSDLQVFPGDGRVMSNVNTIRKFIKFLETLSSSLESLYLSIRCPKNQHFDKSDLDSAFDMLSTKVIFPRLKLLSLANIHTDYQKFIVFLATHRKTLQKYYIHGILATKTGTNLREEAFKKKVLEDLKNAGLAAPQRALNIINCDSDDSDDEDGISDGGDDNYNSADDEDDVNYDLPEIPGFLT